VLLDLPGGGADLLVVGDVGADRQRLAAGLFDIAGRSVQAGLAIVGIYSLAESRWRRV